MLGAEESGSVSKKLGPHTAATNMGGVSSSGGLKETTHSQTQKTSGLPDNRSAFHVSQEGKNLDDAATLQKNT